MNIDVIKYAGAISPTGYARLCKALEKGKKSSHALLIIGTPGGSPDSGFRIARALQHNYDGGFHALVPRYCKSAGTLTLLGARTVFMADESELGPLDIQIKKGDELYSRSSGLDLTQAFAFLKSEAIVSFNEYMHRLVQQGLSTKVAAEIAVKLVNGVLNPIAAQIEPLRVAEMQRATAITYNYGSRLSDSGKNVQAEGLERLVGGYPSHGFVIDRKEAREIFNSVKPAVGRLKELCDDFQRTLHNRVNDNSPHVSIETTTIPGDQLGEQDDYPTQADASLARDASEVKPGLDGTGRKIRSRQVSRKKSAASKSP